MQKKDVNKILDLNNKFYQMVAQDFSKTRQTPWEGWGRVIEIIKESFNKSIVDEGNENKVSDNKIKILDIGCGNGRFYNFLEKNIGNFYYTGIDINNDLLKEATKNRVFNDSHTVNFVKFDIFKNINEINERYDIVLAFGITHHLPNKDFRKKWFSILPKLLPDEMHRRCLLILTFWDFEEESGEYILGWKDNKDALRFCYKYSESDLKEIIKNFENSNLKLLEKYESDKNNLYLIFGRI